MNNSSHFCSVIITLQVYAYYNHAHAGRNFPV